MEKTTNRFSEPFLDKVINAVRFDGHDQVQAELCCPADFPAFNGHFPGQPVLPAVIQLAAIRSLTSELVGLELEPVRTGRLKFKGMVGPGDLINVRVDIRREGENWSSEFKMDHEGSTISSGSIIFRKRV